MPATAPHTASKPHVHTEHGIERPDPYHWLRERGAPEVVAHLQAENAWCKHRTAHLEGLRKVLYDEMLARVQETDSSAPVVVGGWAYYNRTEEGRPYGIMCRRRHPDGPEQILLDVNERAGDREYFALGSVVRSPDHRLLAWTEDVDGSELYALRVVDLDANELLEVDITGIKTGLVFATDSRTLLFTRPDERERPAWVYRVDVRDLDTPPALVFHEADPAFFVGLSRSRDDSTLCITCTSDVTSEAWLLPADAPDATPTVVWPRRHGVQYGVTVRHDRLVIRTNLDAVDFRVVSVPRDAPTRDAVDLVPQEPGVYISGIGTFESHVALYERKGGLPRIRIHRFADGEQHIVAQAEPAYDISVESNPDFHTSKLRYAYSSPVTPDSVIAWDLTTRSQEVLKVVPVPTYDPSDYVCARVFATSHDGVRVPLTLLHRRDLGPGPHPTLLRAYGSYGANFPIGFRSSHISLADRGMVVVMAHPRGGSELGREWWHAGKLLHKKNTFLDIVACAEHLVATAVTSPDRLALMGGSAGGLMVGAVLNLRRDLFRCAVAMVPFVDVATTMCDPSLPLTLIEYDEWGDPNDEEFFRYILSYSPYENVGHGDWPDVLATAGLHDPRVGYWEPAKWVARIRDRRSDSGETLLKVHMGAGHQGRSGRYGRLEDVAFDFAFVLDRLGATER